MKMFQTLTNLFWSTKTEKLEMKLPWFQNFAKWLVWQTACELTSDWWRTSQKLFTQMLTAKLLNARTYLRSSTPMPSAKKSQSFGTWNSMTTLLSSRGSSTGLATYSWEQKLMERETPSTLTSVQERLTGKSKTRCLNSLLSRHGASFIMTEMQTLQNSLPQLWNNAYSRLAMTVQHQLCFQWRMAWMRMHGSESWRQNSTAMFRRLFCCYLGRRESVLCTMKLRNVSWLKSLCLVKQSWQGPFKGAKIWDPLLARFSSRSMPRSVVFPGQLTTCLYLTDLQWYVEWMCSTQQASERSPYLLWRLLWTKQLLNTGQPVWFRVSLAKKHLTHYILE